MYPGRQSVAQRMTLFMWTHCIKWTQGIKERVEASGGSLRGLKGADTGGFGQTESVSVCTCECV